MVCFSIIYFMLLQIKIIRFLPKKDVAILFLTYFDVQSDKTLCTLAIAASHAHLQFSSQKNTLYYQLTEKSEKLSHTFQKRLTMQVFLANLETFIFCFKLLSVFRG